MSTAAQFGREHATIRRHDQRRERYEEILGKIATGVFILEPVANTETLVLEVAFVNEMGARFFGEIDGVGRDILDDAAT